MFMKSLPMDNPVYQNEQSQSICQNDLRIACKRMGTSMKTAFSGHRNLPSPDLRDRIRQQFESVFGNMARIRVESNPQERFLVSR